MYKVSTLVAAGLSAVGLVNAQSQIAAITGGGVQNNGDCGGCYVVADVAGIAFGSEVNTATATNQVVVIPGMNSTYRTTSLIFSQNPFTYDGLSGLATGGGAPSPTAAVATPLDIATSTLILSGVTLTSPTAYNVFTAYSVTSYQATNGGCRLAPGTAIKLASAFSVPIPAGADYASFAVRAEQSFVEFIGKPTCSAGGANLTPTLIVPQTVLTVTGTTTARPTLTPQPAIVQGQTVRQSVGPTAVATRASTFAAGNGTSPSRGGGASTVFVGAPGGGRATSSIAIGGGARQAGSWMAGAAALLMGFVA